MEGVLRHGLLSTEALLDLFEKKDPMRRKLLEEHRSTPYPLSHKEHGDAVIRDTKPLDPKRLAGLLLDNMTPQQYRRMLNQRVFFWPTKKRLNAMLPTYHEEPQTLFIINSQKFVKRHWREMQLSRINSGTIKYDAPKRGPDTFVDFFAYQYRSKNEDPFAEVTVRSRIRDIEEVLDEVWQVENGRRGSRIWPR